MSAKPTKITQRKAKKCTNVLHGHAARCVSGHCLEHRRQCLVEAATTVVSNLHEMTKPMLFFLPESPHLWCTPHGNCAGKQKKMPMCTLYGGEYIVHNIGTSTCNIVSVFGMARKRICASTCNMLNLGYIGNTFVRVHATIVCMLGCIAKTFVLCNYCLHVGMPYKHS